MSAYLRIQELLERIRPYAPEQVSAYEQSVTELTHFQQEAFLPFLENEVSAFLLHMHAVEEQERSSEADLSQIESLVKNLEEDLQSALKKEDEDAEEALLGAL